MLERFRKYLDRPQTVYTLILGYTVAAVLQGLAFGALIWFLRGFLSDDPSSATGAFWLLIALGVISFATMSVTMIAANRISAYDVCGNVIAKIGQRVSRAGSTPGPRAGSPPRSPAKPMPFRTWPPLSSRSSSPPWSPPPPPSWSR